MWAATGLYIGKVFRQHASFHGNHECTAASVSDPGPRCAQAASVSKDVWTVVLVVQQRLLKVEWLRHDKSSWLLFETQQTSFRQQHSLRRSSFVQERRGILGEFQLRDDILGEAQHQEELPVTFHGTDWTESKPHENGAQRPTCEKGHHE